MSRKEAYLSDWTAAVESAADENARSATSVQEFSKKYMDVWANAITSKGR